MCCNYLIATITDSYTAVASASGDARPGSKHVSECASKTCVLHTECVKAYSENISKARHMLTKPDAQKCFAIWGSERELPIHEHRETHARPTTNNWRGERPF